MLLSDVATTSLLDAVQARRRSLGAYIGIPLLRGEEAIGGMGLEFSRPQDFGREQERMAEGIARLLGMALVNARRFTMLTRIRAFGLRISTRQRLGPLTDEMCKAARELVDADHVEVVLVDSPAALLEGSDRGLPWDRLRQREVTALQGSAPCARRPCGWPPSRQGSPSKTHSGSSVNGQWQRPSRGRWSLGMCRL